MLAGLLAGLLGVGGGLVVVPGLRFVFKLQHFPSHNIMHIAVGTSLAVMLATTAQSLITNCKKNDIDYSYYKKMLTGVIAGCIFGVYLSSYLHSKILIVLFAAF